MIPTEQVPDLIMRSASALARAIARREVSAREVVDTQIAWIEKINPALNALCVPRFDRARADADAADAAMRAGDVPGPLHGVPISIKEQFSVGGMPTTLGVEGAVEVAADGPMVARLRAAGAIVLGKTNVPQLLIFNETDNPVYGRTNNPWNSERSPGGSSGGEAALIAAHGSPLGLGSDIGGSLRTPAHACGIASLKPTSGRLSTQDVVPGGFNFGQTAIPQQPGPMARAVEDLSLAMNVLAAPGQQRFDADVAPVPWRDPGEVDVATLRVGFYEDDGFFPAAPSVRRAVREAVAALSAAGVHVQPFSPLRVSDAVETFLGILSADGGAGAKRRLGGSARDRRVQGLLKLAGIPAAARPLVAAFARISAQPRLAQQIAHIRPQSTSGYWALVQAQGEYRHAFVAALERDRLDALVCPPHALPAVTHGSTYWLATASSYAMLFNLVGMPAGVVPVTRARGGEDAPTQRSLDAVVRVANDVRRGTDGLPVGVQVAARHWREDVVLALMSAIERGVSAR